MKLPTEAEGHLSPTRCRKTRPVRHWTKHGGQRSQNAERKSTGLITPEIKQTSSECSSKLLITPGDPGWTALGTGIPTPCVVDRRFDNLDEEADETNRQETRSQNVV